MPTIARHLVLTRTLIVLVLATTAVAVLSAPARASNQQVSVMMDDDNLLYRGDDAQKSALSQMKGLGVDVVRVTVLWQYVAQDAIKGRRKRTFKASDPATYPHHNWDKYDSLVRNAKAVGITPYFDVTGPGPPEVHAKAPTRRDQRTWKPDPHAFYQYVEAIGRRYSGSYRDENQGRAALPRVAFWSLWNEPNQGGWLEPQSELNRTLHKVIPTAPILYRRLYLNGRKALRDTGHDGDVVLIGETAPLGSDKLDRRNPLRPAVFIRELLCLDPAGHPYRGRQARARDCGAFRKFGELRASGWAHHPYTKTLAPTKPDASPDSITMANIGDLPKLLDAAGAASGHLPQKLPVMISEFGYESNPPDPFNGISPNQQAEYLNLGEYIAYTQPRVVGETQFLLRDVAPQSQFSKNSKAYWFTYQSGLFDVVGTAKPAAAAYAFPLVATGGARNDDGSTRVDFWGQLRFRPNRGSGDLVYIQFRPPGGTVWQTVGGPTPVDSPLGFFQTSRTAPGPGVWRAVWGSATDFPYLLNSREVPVNL